MRGRFDDLAGSACEVCGQHLVASQTPEREAGLPPVIARRLGCRGRDANSKASSGVSRLTAHSVHYGG